MRYDVVLWSAIVSEVNSKLGYLGKAKKYLGAQSPG